MGDDRLDELPRPLATLTFVTGAQAGQVVAVDGAPITIGRAADADLVVEDPGVSPHHARVVRIADGPFYAEDLGSAKGTLLGADPIGVALLHAGDLLRLGPNVQLRFEMVAASEELIGAHLYESPLHDPLTRVFNRKYLDERLAGETLHAGRTGGALAILTIDVDAIDVVNDRFGRSAGDRALCAIAARILRTLRAEDVLTRLDGDQFVVLSIGAASAEARQLAERVRVALETLHMSARGQEVRATASIGVAWMAELRTSDEPVAALLALAGARMLRAKASGRNRVCAVGSPRHSAK